MQYNTLCDVYRPDVMLFAFTDSSLDLECKKFECVTKFLLKLDDFTVFKYMHGFVVYSIFLFFFKGTEISMPCWPGWP